MYFIPSNLQLWLHACLHTHCVKTEWLSNQDVFSLPAACFCPAWLPIMPLPIMLSQLVLLMGPWSVALVQVSLTPSSGGISFAVHLCFCLFKNVNGSGKASFNMAPTKPSVALNPQEDMQFQKVLTHAQ